jgi:predicted RNA-binding Zn-ribbon protein involved in translation (DUF1610 family)
MSGHGKNKVKKIGTPRIIFRKNPELGACPNCGEKGTLKRSKARTVTEKLIKIVTPFGYYRCRKCGWRGKLFKYTMTGESIKNLFLYFILALITAGIVRFIIVKFVMK